ncbi:MAG: outer membrane protein transport protein [Pseudomonadota bacterium]
MSARSSVSLAALASHGALAGAALSLSATAAFAGGLDRSGQDIGIIWEDGNYAEVSVGFVMPDIGGEDADGDSVGSVVNDYVVPSLKLRYQVNQQFAIGLIYENPYGADVSYPDNGSNYAGLEASASSHGLTAIGQFRFNEAVSAHAGLRMQTLDSEVKLNGEAYQVPGTGGGFGTDDYVYSGEDSAAFGYLIGAAYEIPAIALRVGLTYFSPVEFDLDTTESNLDITVVGTNPLPNVGAGTVKSTTDVEAPARIHLDFQTGVAPDTLVFGSVKYVFWDGVELRPEELDANTNAALLEYSNDVITYNLGVGRRLSDNLSGSLSVGYEASEGDPVSALGPTDGVLSFSAGAEYAISDRISVAGGASYILPGDAETDSGFSTAEYNDNSAIALGARLGVSF